MKTDYAGNLRKTDLNREVVLCGWVHRWRDHGGLIFIDLRDGAGMVQVVFDGRADQKLLEKAAGLRAEFVIQVSGVVRARSAETINPSLPTGEIEVAGKTLEILNTSKTPPISINEIDGEKRVDEFTRLKYRYLDLRKPANRKNLVARHRVVKLIRDFLDQEGFYEIETPFLTKSTPEGARDYLVPSRVNPGKFYALPQSPQLFKQILMVAGIDKYFQVVRCFRDEDLRADRQPEFTQVDLEVSFPTRDSILDLVEHLLAYLLGGLKNESWFVAESWNLKLPLPRIGYDEALQRFGCDRPDIRFGLELQDLTDEMRPVEFRIFREAIEKGGLVKALKVADGNYFSRGVLNELTEFVKAFGAKGLAWINFKMTGNEIEPVSPIVKFFKDAELKLIMEKLDIQAGEIVFLVADQAAIVNQVLAELRLELGRRLKLIPEEKKQFLWVVDFPLFEFSQTENRWVSLHHPFTAPQGLIDSQNPGAARSQAYDLVLNGVELGGGSLRIHRRDLQEKVFEILGIAPAEAQERFGFLLEALEFGAPPHGGIALGLDRLAMMLLEEKSLREVIAFPKTQSALCPLSGAPSEVPLSQLKELKIKTTLPPSKNEKD